MTDKVTLHQIVGSPNNKKVRIGLHYKGIPYESVPFEFEAYPGDRSGLAAFSRQPLTPVLRHGDRTIFDSGAILRYLEANFPDTRPLFTTDYEGMHRIEEIELYGRTALAGPVGMAFQQAFSPTPDLDVCRQASGMLHEATARLEEQLGVSEYLCGDAMTAGDVACAPLVALSTLTEETAVTPISRFFHQNYHLGDGREKTRAWAGRVMAWAEEKKAVPAER